MQLATITRRFALVPFLVAAFLAAPPVLAGEDDDWGEGEYETFEYDDDDWGASYGFESQWWEDEEYEVEGASYREDAFGTYDQDYDWDTDESWWNEWSE